MTFFKISCVLLILFLSPLVFFEIDDAFAAAPNFISKDRAIISASDPATTIITIPSISIGSQLDRLLVTSVSLDNKKGPSTGSTVSWISYGPTGCTLGGLGYQNFTRVPTSTSFLNTVTTNEIWTLTAPTQNQNCDVVVGLSQAHGNLGFLNNTAAVARTVFYSGVDQANPVHLDTGYSATRTPGAPNPLDTTPQVTIPVTNSSQLVFDTMSSGTTGNPTADISQTRQNSYNGAATTWNTAYSTQLGAVDTSMSWTIDASAPWAISAIIINSCDFSSCGVASSSSSSSGNDSCEGDCSAPTLGLDKNHQRVVTNGFAFNDNPIDAELYYTSYPLITAYVGEENAIELQIYENDGPSNLAHVGIAFGLGYGESFSESNAIINWDRNYDGTENVSVIDPYNVLDNVRVDVTEVECNDIGSMCTNLIAYHTFRAPLEFNMIATNMWDHDRNAWQNYFNHGLQIVGDSLNPPKTHQGIYHGKIFSLIETGKNLSVDESGYVWTLEKGVWDRNYVSPKNIDRPLTNPDKIWAINHVMKDKPLDDISNAVLLDRNLNHFVMQKDYQILLAENVIEEICPKCFDDPYFEIDDVYAYDFPEFTTRINSLNQTMYFESERANGTMEEMRTLTSYLGKIYK